MIAQMQLQGTWQIERFFTFATGKWLLHSMIV
jgi:hypothetical protein